MKRVAVACVLLVGSAADVAADTRHTTEAVQVRKKPGEKEPVVAQLPANTEVTVVAEDGRWVKVRVRNVEGYVTRTQLDQPAAPATGTPTAWSSHAPQLDKTEAGAAGATATATATATTSEPEPAAFTRPERGSLAIRTAAGIGYRLVGMDMTANANGGLASYVLDSDAVAGAIAADAAVQLAPRITAVADARVEISDASPGITYPGPSGTPGKIPFQTFAADLGARAGYRAHDAIDLAARAGLHYDAFLPTQVDNVGMLPREALLGLTLGVRVEVLPPHSRFGAAARFDWLAIGSRSQTPGLQDGTSSSAHAWWGGASVAYVVTPRFSLYTAYDFGRATTSWSGASERVPAATSSHRVDTTQLLQLGVSAAL